MNKIAKGVLVGLGTSVVVKTSEDKTEKVLTVVILGIVGIGVLTLDKWLKMLC